MKGSFRIAFLFGILAALVALLLGCVTLPPGGTGRRAGPRPNGFVVNESENHVKVFVFEGTWGKKELLEVPYPNEYRLTRPELLLFEFSMGESLVSLGGYPDKQWVYLPLGQEYTLLYHLYRPGICARSFGWDVIHVSPNPRNYQNYNPHGEKPYDLPWLARISGGGSSEPGLNGCFRLEVFFDLRKLNPIRW